MSFDPAFFNRLENKKLSWNTQKLPWNTDTHDKPWNTEKC